MLNSPFEPMSEASTCDAMRAELHKASRSDVMIRNIFDHAAYSGLSGEDKYTMMAYNAIQRLRRVEKLMLEDSMTRIAGSMMFDSDGPATGKDC